MSGAAHEKLQGELDIAAAAEESGDVAEAKGQVRNERFGVDTSVLVLRLSIFLSLFHD